MFFVFPVRVPLIFKVRVKAEKKSFVQEHQLYKSESRLSSKGLKPDVHFNSLGRFLYGMMQVHA